MSALESSSSDSKFTSLSTTPYLKAARQKRHRFTMDRPGMDLIWAVDYFCVETTNPSITYTLRLQSFAFLFPQALLQNAKKAFSYGQVSGLWWLHHVGIIACTKFAFLLMLIKCRSANWLHNPLVAVGDRMLKSSGPEVES